MCTKKKSIIWLSQLIEGIFFNAGGIAIIISVKISAGHSVHIDRAYFYEVRDPQHNAVTRNITTNY